MMAHNETAHGEAANMHIGEKKSYTKKISDHVAYGLVIYTLMLIFLVTKTLKSDGMSIFPYFMLVVLVGLVIPLFHSFDSKWRKIENNAEFSHDKNSIFRQDCMKIWALSIGLPIIWMLLFSAL
ncbi:hypothetical protein LPB140_00850 [Sphingorhabdus lutea]|uniref:Uncharacterized protein n=1 Tax=Sphingorhabdus lutea TaxID=1913578 RepID=A0A1L3J923_9SPHN|nr:hypothetical protein [Sphingorhabdus lutea]APG61624.1 hypothetical protein LPB140_00850 [Sphingorhabdus lutea]